MLTISSLSNPERSSRRLLIIHHDDQIIQPIQDEFDRVDIAISYDIVQESEFCQRQLETQTYDAVICNDYLPEWDVLSALALVQNSSNVIPFILLTTAAREKAALEKIKTDVTDYGLTDYVLTERLFRLPIVLKRSCQIFSLQQQQQTTTSQLRKKSQRDAIFNHIIQAMRQTLVVPDILQTTLNKLQDELGVTRCLFLRFSEVDFRIRQVGETTLHRDQMYDVRCDLCSFYRESLVSGEFVIIHEFDRVPLPAQQIAQDFSVYASVLAPLTYDQRCLGLICLHQCDENRQWTEDEVWLIKAVAGQCAIAVYQAELYDKVQQELAKRQCIEAKLRYDAFHDTLTNLPNRALLMERLEQAIQSAQDQTLSEPGSTACPFAILFIDLDHFKDVNDSLGHLAGDRLLKDAAKRLAQTMGANDMVARFGGDEFVVLLEGIDSITQVIEMAQAIHHVLTPAFLIDDQDIALGTSIGIALGYKNHYQQPIQLLRDADAAMYRAKHRGRNCYEIFDQSMHAQAVKRLQLTNALRRGIEKDQLCLAYQPIISLQTGHLEGFEALVRWQHPERGLLSPDEFIPLAEDTGLILAIDMKVFEMACRQLRCLHDRFPSHKLSMSINLSGKQLSQKTLAVQIDQILAQTGADPEFLKLEITESSIMQNNAIAKEQLQRLKDRQIQISIDDFGTGYSSLSYLQHLPVDILKIDRSFVNGIEASATNFKIVKTITTLAQNLDLDIVIEGLETAQQIEILSPLQCAYGQGYFFSPPFNETDLISFTQAQVNYSTEIQNPQIQGTQIQGTQIQGTQPNMAWAASHNVNKS